jgi:hypothetical protein
MSASIGSVSPGSTRVWLVKAGDPSATAGSLQLQEGSLRFVPDIGSEAMTIPVAEIRGVRRRRGTPVLSLSYPTEDGMRDLFVYFVKPPPLRSERPAAPRPVFRSPRRLERSAAAMTLRAANRLLKRDIEGWVRALREAGAGA